MSQYFEAHITLNPHDLGTFWREQIEDIAHKHKFHTSILIGDEKLGNGKHLYLTSSEDEYCVIRSRLDKLIADLRENNIYSRRSKIEFVVFDSLD